MRRAHPSMLLFHRRHLGIFSRLFLATPPSYLATLCSIMLPEMLNPNRRATAVGALFALKVLHMAMVWPKKTIPSTLSDIHICSIINFFHSKLLKHLKTISKDPQPMSKGKTAIHDTSLSSLSLRINQPYWLMHQGNCEHFIAIDQIRYSLPIYSEIFPQSHPSIGFNTHLMFCLDIL